MNVGIIGLGKMGLLHTGILNTLDDLNITSFADKENLLTKYMKTAFPQASIYNDYIDMIDREDLDVIYITTPSFSHLPIMKSCVQHNVNFFVEKPLTKNLDEAKQICSSLKSNNLIHSVGYNVRFNDTFSKTKSLLDSKILGEISHVKSSMYVSSIFSKPPGWRFNKKKSGGGVLLEFGCHLVDMLLWYLGRIDNVKGTTKKVYSDVEDFAHMDIEFTNSAKGELDTSWSVEGYRIPEINIEIEGSNGKLRVNQDFIDIQLKSKVKQLEDLKTRIYKQELNSNVSFDVGGSDYTKEDEHVIDCVKEKHCPLVDAFEASKIQSVIQAMYDASSSNESKEVEYLE